MKDQFLGEIPLCQNLVPLSFLKAVSLLLRRPWGLVRLHVGSYPRDNTWEIGVVMVLGILCGNHT